MIRKVLLGTVAAAVMVVVAVSLVPGGGRPETPLPGPVEHVLAYAGLAVLVGLAARSTRQQVLLGLFVVLLAGILELMQLAVPGRDSAFLDFVASALGAGVGTTAVMYFRNRRGFPPRLRRRSARGQARSSDGRL